jgi:hypothetical protein
MSPIYVPGKVVLAKEFTWNETVWNPSMIQTALWLDAADASTLTLSGSNVTQWSDKSGNSRHATPYSISPTYNATGLDNKGTIQFNGSTQALQSPDFYQSDWYILALARTTNASADQTIVGKFNSTLDRELLFRFSASNKITTLINPTGSSGANNTTVTTTANAGTSFGIFGFLKSGSLCEIGINGTIETGTFNTATVHNGNAPFAIGRDGSASFLNGSIQKIVVTQGVPTASTMRKLEGWAAWSTNLQSLLPSDHPYKTVGPTP